MGTVAAAAAADEDGSPSVACPAATASIAQRGAGGLVGGGDQGRKGEGANLEEMQV